MNKLRTFAIVYGAVLLLVILGVSVFIRDLGSSQFFIVRTVLAVAAAGFGCALAGSFRIQGKISRLSVVATGALALGALIYLAPQPRLPPDDDTPPLQPGTMVASPEIRNEGGKVKVTFDGVTVLYQPKKALSDQEIRETIESHPNDWREVLQTRFAGETIASPNINTRGGEVAVDYSNVTMTSGSRPE